MQRAHQRAHGQPPLGDLVDAEAHHHRLAGVGQQADDHIDPDLRPGFGKFRVGGLFVILLQRLQVFPLDVVDLDGRIPVDQVADHDVELFQRHRIEVCPLFQRLPLYGRGNDGTDSGNDDDHGQIAVDVQQRDHAGDQHQNAVCQLQARDIEAVHQHLDLIVQRGDIVLPLLLLKFPGRHMDDVRHDLFLEAEQLAVSVFARAELPRRLKQEDAQNADEIADEHTACVACTRLHRIDGVLEIDRLERGADS